MTTDTLTTARELEAKGVEHTAAEAIATAIHNHTQTHLENLVTKTDLALAIQQLEALSQDVQHCWCGGRCTGGN